MPSSAARFLSARRRVYASDFDLLRRNRTFFILFTGVPDSIPVRSFEHEGPQGLRPRLVARVSHRVFLGDRTHLRVTTPEAGELLVDAARDCPLRVGDGVALSIDPRALMACGRPQ